MDLLPLIDYINQNINTKFGDDRITGAVHNAVLLEVVTSLIEIIGTGFGGDISLTDDPGEQASPIHFLAADVGEYVYCGGVVVTALPAYIIWNGTQWKAKNIGLPVVANDPNKCRGLAFADDNAPDGEVGDWFVFVGGGTLNWPGETIDNAGIVYLHSKTVIGGVPVFVWKIEKFGVTGENSHYLGTYTSIESLELAHPTANPGDYAIVDAGVGSDAVKYVWDDSDDKWVLSSGGAFDIDSTPTQGSTNAVSSGGVYLEFEGKADKEHTQDASTITLPTPLLGASNQYEYNVANAELVAGINSFPFAFSGLESFKIALGRNLTFTSIIKAANITDLRVGKNGATPTTMTFPYAVIDTDVLEFAATYDRYSDSYFTLKI